MPTGLMKPPIIRPCNVRSPQAPLPLQRCNMAHPERKFTLHEQHFPGQCRDLRYKRPSRSWALSVSLVSWRWLFCILTMQKCNTYIVSVLVILRRQIYVVLIVVINWCTCTKYTIYCMYLLYPWRRVRKTMLKRFGFMALGNNCIRNDWLYNHFW